jgi:molybdenum cofactor cytidylyltransferase
MSLAIVLLAAGDSRRFQNIKQLAMIDGELLINRQLRQYIKLGLPIYLVLGAHRDEILTQIEQDLMAHIELVLNLNWQQGMGHSIASAVTEITRQQDYDHLMISLLDQAQISVSELHNLIKQSVAHSDVITCSEYDGEIGAPAIFPNHFFDSLRQLKGDEGAKQLIYRTHHKQMVNMPSAAFDLDTPEQLNELRKSLC